MYLSLARKYRPKTFADVAVQSHVANTLKGAIARGRVAHGYLLCGPRGVGKTTLARVLAMALNCERRDDPATRARVGEGEPCGECASCVRIWAGAASLDVVEIDAASNRGVDDARDLRERAMYAPSGEDRYKVYIVDEAHMLTREAWNALLKILEEPPPRVVFVFATTEPQKIAQAAAPVLSRLQRFDFKRIGPLQIRERLAAVLSAEGIGAEDEALVMLARAADGSMRDALSLADQALSLGDGQLTPARVREALGLVAEDEYLAMLDLIAARRAGDVFPAVARLVDAGVDLGAFLAGFADLLRAQLAIALGGDAPELSERSRAALAARRDALGAGDVLRMLTVLGELEPRFRRSGQQQLLLEATLVRFALLDRTVAIEDVLRELGGGGHQRAVDEHAAVATPRQSTAPPGSMAATRLSDRSPVRPTEPPPIPRPSGPSGAALEVNTLVERWGEVIARVRDDGRGMLAAALEHARPVAVSEHGDVTLEVEASDAVQEEGIARNSADVLGAIAALFPGATRLVVRRAEALPADSAAPRRLTEEAVKGARLAALRKRDASLDAAVDALDLELLE